MSAPTITVNSVNANGVSGAGNFYFDGGTANFTTFNLNGGTVASGTAASLASAVTVNNLGTGAEVVSATGSLTAPSTPGGAPTVSGGATFNQSGGLNYAGALTLGLNGGVGVYNLSGGTLNAASETIGGDSASAGLFNHAEGVNNVNGALTVSAGSFYELSGATGPTQSNFSGLYAASAQVNSGGDFNQSGGLAQIGALTVASGGTYTLSGGAIRNLTSETIAGAFTQSGVSVNTGGNATVTIENGGVYDLRSGTLSPNTAIIAAGGQFIFDGGKVATPNPISLYTAMTLDKGGTVTSNGAELIDNQVYFTQLGGTNTTANLTIVSPQSALPSAFYDLQGGTLSAPTITVNSVNANGVSGAGNFYFDGGTANFTTFNLNGGTVASGTAASLASAVTVNNLGTGAEVVSATGSLTAPSTPGGAPTVSGGATFNQSGGLNYAGALTLGLNGGVGVYNLSGGTLNAASETIGGDSASAGLFNHAEGVNNVNGALTVSAGSFYELSGATGPTQSNFSGLYAASAQVNSGGDFNQSGGLAQIGALTVASGGTYTLSGGAIRNLTSETIAGAFTQSGVSVNTGGNATVTIENGGVYDLRSGTLSPNTAIIAAGGQFIFDGGKVATPNPISLYTAMTLDKGGTVTSNGAELIDNQVYFTQLGGTNTTANLTIVSPQSALPSAFYDLQGGTLSAPTITVNSVNANGVSGAGNFYFDGGTANFTTFNLNGGTVASGTAASLASAVTVNNLGTGAEVVSATGSLTAPSTPGGAPTVSGGATFNQSGGLNYAGALTLGLNGGVGVYNLSGGTLNAASETIGGDSASAGLFNHAEGVNNVNGALTVSAGSFYELSGATGPTQSNFSGLYAASAQVNSGGDFNQSGGLAQIGALTVASSGAYELQGGTLNAPVININQGGQLTREGGGVNFTTLNNAGALNNVTGLLSSSGTFTNAGSGVFTNSGTFNNSGNFQNQSGGVVQGAGVFVSSGRVQTTGNFSQNDVQVAESVFTQNASATVTLGSLEVGTVAQQYPNYQLLGGALYASTEIIGQAGGAIYGCGVSTYCNDFGSTPGATGSLTQVAGANTVAGSLVVGASAGATGGYQLVEGATLTAGQEIIGQQGSISEFECVLGCGVTLSGGAGSFIQSGTSANTVGALTISANQGGSGSSGSYDLQGGTLNAKTINVNQGGTFTQSGTGNNTVGTLTISTNQAFISGGNYDLQGGVLNAATIAINPGGAFSKSGGVLNFGSFAVDGEGSGFVSTDPTAQVTTAGNEYIGATASVAAAYATSSFTQNGSFASNDAAIASSTHTVTGALVLGLDAGSTGNYTLNGGALSAAVEEVGFLGAGTMVQTGGVNTIGPYNGAARTTIASSDGTATVNELNGALTIASQAGSSGAYELQGGTLNAPVININQGGQLTREGGGVNFTTLNNAGALNNVTGLLSSSGTFTNAGSGVFTNSGTFNNSGNFQNQSGGVVQGAGVFVSSGRVQTTGNFSQNDVQVAESVFTQNASATVTLGSLEVGTVAQQYPNYQLLGGALYASTEIIGQAGGAIYGCGVSTYCNDFGSTPGAIGSLTQVAGANTVAGSLVVGASAGATGGYQLVEGATLTAGQEIIGQQGSISEFECVLGCGVTLSGGAGSFIQSGTSANTVGALTISANQGGSGSSGSYDLQGGTLNAKTINVNQGGTFTQSGGSAMVSSNTSNAGSVSVTANVFTTLGVFTTSGIVTIGSGATLTAGTFIQTGGSTLINNGALDPAVIMINGGVFGGSGTVVGNVEMTDGTVQVSASPEPLHIEGSYSQTGGEIKFEIDPNGHGGYLESSLVFDPGNSVSISGTKIVFDFLNGANPLAFFDSGALNLDAFFQESDGSLFSNDFNLRSLFAGDTFATNLGGFDITGFSANGAVGLAQSSAVPEPSTWALLALGFAGLGFVGYRKAQENAAVAA